MSAGKGLQRGSRDRRRQVFGSPRLLAILTTLLDASVIYVSASVEASPDLRTRAGDDHANLIETLRQRDADGAEAAIKQHLGIPGGLLDLP